MPQTPYSPPSARVSDPPPADQGKKLKTFRIYMHPDRPRPIAIKVGFCWPAFFIGPLWFLLNRMWVTFLLVLLIFVGAHFALDRAHFGGGFFLLYLIIWLAIGFIANPLLASDLLSQGYAHRTTVQASSMSKAKRPGRPRNGARGEHWCALTTDSCATTFARRYASRALRHNRSVRARQPWTRPASVKLGVHCLHLLD